MLKASSDTLRHRCHQFVVIRGDLALHQDLLGNGLGCQPGWRLSQRAENDPRQFFAVSGEDGLVGLDFVAEEPERCIKAANVVVKLTERRLVFFDLTDQRGALLDQGFDGGVVGHASW